MAIFLTDKGKFEIEETGEGFLKGIVTISRAGVFDYYVGDQPVKKAKLPKDLFCNDTINSVRGKPVTDGHPVDIDTGRPILVTPQNHDLYSKGNVSEPWIDGEEIKAREIIYDENLITDILERKSKREVSIGFMTDCDDTPGTYNGEQYDSAQRNIRVNHVAHVEAGRAGPQCSIHVDMKEDGMLKFRTDAGQEIEIDGANAKDTHAELVKLKGERDEAAGKVTEADKTIEDLNKKVEILEKDQPEGDEIKKLKKDLGTAEDKLETANDAKEKLEGKLAEADKKRPEQVRQAARDYAALEADAKAAGVENIDSMTDRQIKEGIISAKLPYKEGVKVDDKSDEAVDARYEAAMEVCRAEANTADESQPGGPQGPSGDLATDEEINKKRAALKNLHTDKKGSKTEE